MIINLHFSTLFAYESVSILYLFLSSSQTGLNINLYPSVCDWLKVWETDRLSNSMDWSIF